jgi:hypothetical protein
MGITKHDLLCARYALTLYRDYELQDFDSMFVYLFVAVVFGPKSV